MACGVRACLFNKRVRHRSYISAWVATAETDTQGPSRVSPTRHHGANGSTPHGTRHADGHRNTPHLTKLARHEWNKRKNSTPKWSKTFPHALPAGVSMRGAAKSTNRQRKPAHEVLPVPRPTWRQARHDVAFLCVPVTWAWRDVISHIDLGETRSYQEAKKIERSWLTKVIDIWITFSRQPPLTSCESNA